ncbi:MAG: hypothetical protein GY896_11565, partial [Gammaproteobacteria bacterium]|nr:hypothetical protein [Gammaproteobacteria bacterium]
PLGAHKPFLLLYVMDMIAQGQVIENFIEPSFELVDTWNGYWNTVMPILTLWSQPEVVFFEDTYLV